MLIAEIFIIANLGFRGFDTYKAITTPCVDMDTIEGYCIARAVTTVVGMRYN